MTDVFNVALDLVFFCSLCCSETVGLTLCLQVYLKIKYCRNVNILKCRKYSLQKHLSLIPAEPEFVKMYADLCHF
jgi:hypothetical protein